jgi:subtilase-type serine protease
MMFFKFTSRLCLIVFLIGTSSSSFAAVASIDFFKFESFKETIQLNVIKKNNLSEINTADLDFVRANDKQLKIIRNEIKFSTFNEEKFLNSYTELNSLFTEISFDIYQESKFYLITNNVLTPGIDTKLRRISANYINQFYGLSPISVSMPVEKSKYLPIESPSLTAAEAVPALGMTGVTIASVLGLGAAAGGGSGGGSGGGGGGSNPLVIISSGTTDIYDSDSSGFTINVSLSPTSTNPVTVNFQSTGTATLSSDFNGPSSVTVPAGSSSTTVTYTPVADSTYEGTEIIKIEISSVINGTEYGTQSVSVNLKEYALRLGTAFTDRGNSSARAALTEYANVGNHSSVNSTIHPYSLMNIHKAHAYWDGSQHLSGKGEVIHVADFNCDENHQEFTQGGKTTTVVGVAFDADSAADFHCNLVAGYAAGGFSGSSSSNDIMGVAYEADLVFSRVPGTSYLQKAVDLDSARALNAIASNNSWSTSCADEASDVDAFIAANPSATIMEAVGGALAGCGTISSTATAHMQAYVDSIDAFQTAGGIMVFAAGNDNSDSDVSALAALPIWFSQLSEAYITVAYMEVRGSPTISGSNFFQLSNPCQQMAENCLVADAWEIFGAYWHDDSSSTSNYTDITGGGSSSASPMVSGIIALLNQAFPNHTPEMIVDRLLASANNSWFTPTGNTTFTTHGNSIKHGYHSIWGHGIPDAYAALSPITTSLNPLIGISTGGSMVNNADNFENLFPPSITELTANPSFGDSLVLGLKNENGYFYDALGGGFKFDLSTLVKSKSNKSDIKEFINNDIINLRNHRNVAMFNNNYINVLGSIDRNKNFVTSVSIDTPSIPIQYFHNLIPSSFSADSVYANPFVNQKNGGLGLSTQYKHGNSTFMLGMHDSGNHSGLFGQASDDTKTIATSFIHNSRSVDHLAVISGVMEEKDTLLGSKHSGAIGISGSNPKSYFNGFNIEQSFNDNLSFKANTILARTIVKNPNNSLIHSFSPISSSSFEISLIKKNIFDTDDKLLISLSQPNRIETGSMNFKIQDLADSYGNIKHNLKKINLEPSGRQIDFGINYIKKLNDNAIFGVKNVLSKDYSHYKDSNLNHLITATASINF